MNKIFKLLSGIRQKTIKPKVYALVIKMSTTSMLYVGVHYTLEEARTAAIKEALVKGVSGHDATVKMFTSRPLKELVAQATKIEVKGEPEQEEQQNTGKLMQEIVGREDIQLFKENKDSFTKVEIRFLEEKLGLDDIND